MLPISYGWSRERQFFAFVTLSESKHDTASIMQSLTSSASLYGLPFLPRMYAPIRDVEARKFYRFRIGYLAKKFCPFPNVD